MVVMWDKLPTGLSMHSSMNFNGVFFLFAPSSSLTLFGSIFALQTLSCNSTYHLLAIPKSWKKKNPFPL